MNDWTIDMSEEKDINALLDDGWHEAKILSVKLITEQESKSKNPYFFWSLQTNEGNIDMRTTLLKGKRWLLKQTLEACGIVAKENDPLKKYSFSKSDVEGKTIMVKVINKMSRYISNAGEPIEIEKSEIRQVKTFDASLSLNESVLPPPPKDLADF